MLTRAIARSLMGLVPEKLTAVVTLRPDSMSPTVVTSRNSWIKPLDVDLSNYDGTHLQGNELRIKIPDQELNPENNGREIRPNDRVAIDGVNHNVLTARLMSVRTVWECVCRKEMI